MSASPPPGSAIGAPTEVEEPSLSPQTGRPLTKRGEATLEGDLHPFMAHLQYFKDLLALPRHNFTSSGS